MFQEWYALTSLFHILLGNTAAYLPEWVPVHLLPFLTKTSTTLSLAILEIFVTLCTIPKWHPILKRQIGEKLFDIRYKMENKSVHSKTTFILNQLYIVRRKRVRPDNRRINKYKRHQHGRGWWKRMALIPDAATERFYSLEKSSV